VRLVATPDAVTEHRPAICAECQTRLWAEAEVERLYHKLGETVTLYDDRDISTGVKLKDADLLGSRSELP
jgi:hypothetical protein